METNGCVNGRDGDYDGDGGGAGGGCCITSMVDHGSVETHRYYLARRTVLEMLRHRGYIVADSELTRSLDEFRSIHGNNVDLERLRICAPRRSNPSRKILVIFCGTAEIRKQVIVGILHQIVNKGSLDSVILILQSKMNCHAKKVVEEYPVKVETFEITDLLVNVTKHILVPNLEVLNAEQKQNILKKYNANDNQIPRMLENDAIARYYGLEKGQVLKISYEGGWADSVVTYRCVR